MKRTLRFFTLALLSIFLGFSSFSQISVVAVDDSWVGTTPGTTVYYASNPYTFGTDAFDNIPAGISAVTAGGTVHVANGSYVQASILGIGKSLLLDGESKAGVIIDVTALTSYGVHVQASNVTLKDFTVAPNTAGGQYALKADPNGALPHSNLSLDNISITASKKTAFDVHGIDNVTLSGLTALNTVAGNGISISGCVGVTITNCTTAGNAWGGIAVYVSKPAYLNRGSSNVSFDFALNSVDEWFYEEDEFGLMNTNITVSNWTYALENDYSATANMLMYTNKPIAYALNLGANLNAKFSNVKTVIYDPSGTNWHVGNGMAIQPAIDAASSGDMISVYAGTYTEQLTITTNNLTIEGAGKSSTTIKSPVTLMNFFASSENNYPIVYVSGVAGFTLKNLTVDGDGKGNANYRFTGIGFYNAGGTVMNVDVKNIWETPFSGNQHGNGVYSYSDAGGPYSITCKNMTIENYQKNAMALLGNAVLDLDNITTIGEGPTSVTAQNGIQVGPLTTGLIKNCEVRDDQYTGGYWTASGIILDGDVDVQTTDITGCQTSIYAIDGDNDLDKIDITAPLVYLEEAYGIIAYSTSVARSGSGLPQPSPFDGTGGNAGRAANMTLNLTQSKITGNYEAGSIGVYLFSENGLTATINKCNIGNWEYGIYAEGYGSGTVTATVNKCNLAGNTYGFVNVPGGSREDQDGTDNWWGDDSGPYNPTTNPGGLGSEVSDFIDYDNWINDPVDISVFNNQCGVLDVMAVPSMPLNGQVTNILFAVKWINADYPDVFLSTTTDYNINLQYYATDGIYKYAVFGTDLTAINWQALVGDTILTITLKQNQPEGTVTDFEIADDAWTAANNADYYFEFWGSDLTGVITGFADDVYLASCDLQLHAKAFLQGPYNTATNLMNADLTVNGPIPLDQPFTGAPWNYDGEESLTTLPADMVDWVLVELRPTPSGTPIRKAGLLFKDGTVRSHVDSFFDIYFTGDFMPNSDYYVALFHRNHMPVMSAAAVNIPNAGDRYDFSDMADYPSYGGAAAQVLLETGVHGMISGDVNKDGDLIYSGPANDRALILQKITTTLGVPYINGVIQGYYNEDLTMNSWVKYSGSGNDQRLIILNLIELTGTYNLNATYASLVPGYGTKALHVSPGTGPLDIAIEESATRLSVVLMTRDYIAEGWTDNIQFTLSWDEKNSRMDQLVKNYISDYDLQAQGGIVNRDGRKYQVFAMVDWFALPQPFIPGDKATVLSFDKGGFSGTDMKAAIAADAYTRHHNGDYYVSLAGFDQTGQVLDALTGIGDPASATAAFSLYPNPASQGYVNVSFLPTADETLVVTVTDISSRIISQESLEVMKGQPVVKQISLSGLSKGVYFIRLQGNNTNKTGKIEIH